MVTRLSSATLLENFSPTNTENFILRHLDLQKVSYMPKKSICFLDIVNAPHGVVEDGTKKLPEIISFYNSTKVGVDDLDQICANYKVGRSTWKWPQIIWYRIKDVGAANAAFIYNCGNPNNEVVQQDFLISLGRGMIYVGPFNSRCSNNKFS